MKLTIVTTCHVSEFDENEFPHYITHTQAGSEVTVLETIELDERQYLEITP